jgi:hypothetical protein
MTDLLSCDIMYVNPVCTSSARQFLFATLTNMVATLSWFTTRKSVKPSNFEKKKKIVQNPIKYEIDMCDKLKSPLY